MSMCFFFLVARTVFGAHLLRVCESIGTSSAVPEVCAPGLEPVETALTEFLFSGVWSL